MLSVGQMAHSKTFLLTVCCAKMCTFLDISLINNGVGFGEFLGEIRTTPNSNFYGFYEVNGSVKEFFTNSINGC